MLNRRNDDSASSFNDCAGRTYGSPESRNRPQVRIPHLNNRRGNEAQWRMQVSWGAGLRCFHTNKS